MADDTWDLSAETTGAPQQGQQVTSLGGVLGQGASTDPTALTRQIGTLLAQINQSPQVQLPTMPRGTPSDGTRPGWLGLLGEALSGGQSPLYHLRGQQEDLAGSRALLNFGINTMLASGPNPVRTPITSALAAGLQGAQQSMDQSQQAAYTQAGQQFEQQKGLAELGIQQQDARIKQLAALLPFLRLENTAGMQSPFGGGTAGTAPPTPGSKPLPQMPPEYEPYFQQASKLYNIPVEVLKAQAAQESGFNTNKVGGNGEIGIMQVLPSTAANPGFHVAGISNPKEALRDPATNIMMGAAYLRGRAGPNADLSNPAEAAKALTAYNGGGDPAYAAHVFQYLPGQRPAGTQFAGPGAPTGATAPAPRPQLPPSPAAAPVAPQAAPAAAPTTEQPVTAPTPPVDIPDEQLSPPAYLAKYRTPLTAQQVRDATVGSDTAQNAQLAAQAAAVEKAHAEADSARLAYNNAFNAAKAGGPAVGDPNKAFEAYQKADQAEADANNKFNQLVQQADTATKTNLTDLNKAQDAQLMTAYGQMKDRQQKGQLQTQAEKAASDLEAQRAKAQLAQTAEGHRLDYQNTQMGKLTEEAVKARDNRDQLTMLGALSSAADNVPWANIQLPGGVNLGTAMMQAGMLSGNDASKFNASQAFTAGITKFAQDMRSGQGMGRLTNQELTVLMNMLPNMKQDPTTRAAVLGYMQQVYQRKIDFANGTANHMADKDTPSFTEAMSRADSDLGPIIPTVPTSPSEDVKAHDQWIISKIPPGSLYKDPDNTIHVYVGPKPASQPPSLR